MILILPAVILVANLALIDDRFDQTWIVMWLAFFISLRMVAFAGRIAPDMYYFRLAETAYVEGKFDQAVGYLTEALQVRKNFYKARRLRAYAMFKLAKYDLALVELDALLAIKKHDAEAMFMRARVKFNLKDYAGVIEDADEMNRLDRSNADAYALRAIAYFQINRFDEGIVEALQALKIQPSHRPARLALGLSYYATQKYEDALSTFSTMIQAFAPDYDLFLQRGNVLYQLKKYDLALLDFNRAIELKPSRYDAHNNRGSCSFMLDEFEQATLDFERSLAIEENPYAYCNLGNIHLVKGEGIEAIADFEKARDLSPELKRAVVGLSLGYYLQGDIEKAREYWAGLVKDEPCFQEAEWVVEEYGQHPKMAALIRRFFEEGQITNPPTA
ncbi:MAG: tetratricopeptide repeat protein [Anaerolineae bacterium]|nr:tetratricopeptide repeat protein [Anaerolineae bacterium]